MNDREIHNVQVKVQEPDGTSRLVELTRRSDGTSWSHDDILVTSDGTIIECHNHSHSTLTELIVAFAPIACPAGSIMHTCLDGGQRLLVDDMRWGIQYGAGAWPGRCYAPLAVLQTPDECIELDFHNGDFVPVVFSWFAGPNGPSHHVNPVLSWRPYLTPGSSIVAACHRRHVASPDHAYDGRAKLCGSMGIEKASTLPGGVWAWGQPEAASPSAFGRVESARLAGAEVYLEWPSPTDAWHHHTHPPDWLFLNGVAPAGMRVGTLVNPYASPLMQRRDAMPFPGGWRQSGRLAMPLDVRDPIAIEYRAELIAWLRARGVTMCFFDTGGYTPHHLTGWDTIAIIRQFAAGGITLILEAACDVFAHATGASLIFPRTERHPFAARIITPDARLLSTVHQADTSTNDLSWIDRDASLGYTPIAHVNELARRPKKSTSTDKEIA